MKTLLPCELSPQSPSLPFIRQFYVKRELCGLRRMETAHIDFRTDEPVWNRVEEVVGLDVII